MLSVETIMTRLLPALNLLLVFVTLSSATGYDPSPNPEAVVQVGKARFTVLTEHLVRMEWGGANDAATFAFVNRNLSTPKFTTNKDGNWTVIQTSAVMVILIESTTETWNVSVEYVLIRFVWTHNLVHCRFDTLPLPASHSILIIWRYLSK